MRYGLCRKYCACAQDCHKVCIIRFLSLSFNVAKFLGFLWVTFLCYTSLTPCAQEVRESRRRHEQRIVEVDSGVRQDYEFKLAQALQV